MTSFADVATHDPARGLYGESAVTTQEHTSFAPLLLSLEMWTPHRYASQALRFVASFSCSRLPPRRPACKSSVRSLPGASRCALARRAVRRSSTRRLIALARAATW